MLAVSRPVAVTKVFFSPVILLSISIFCVCVCQEDEENHENSQFEHFHRL